MLSQSFYKYFITSAKALKSALIAHGSLKFLILSVCDCVLILPEHFGEVINAVHQFIFILISHEVLK